MRQQEQVKAYYASIVQGCSGYAELKMRSACNAKASDCFRQNGSNVKKFTQCIIPGGQEELSRAMQATQKEIVDKLNGRGKIGININNRVVVTVVSGGGAEKAGIMVGDIVVSADDQELTGKYVDDVMRITGEPNSVARLKIMRGTKELLLDVQRSGAD
jgi:C-terminal processing protease CtpA/Prc